MNDATLFTRTMGSTLPPPHKQFKQDFQNQIENNETIEFSKIPEWLNSSENVNATPHSQRSKATITIKQEDSQELKLEELVALVEQSLKTPVQSIVKREDEKEFAKLNGQNLMFAEDAARKIKSTLNSEKNISSFSVKVSHYESLHAHNAVAYAEKNFS